VVRYVAYAAASLAGLALLVVALVVIADVRGSARALTQRASEYGAGRGVLFRGEYSVGLIRAAAVGVAAIGLTGPATSLEALGVPFVGGAPFVLYLTMVAGIFYVAAAVRIRSRFRAIIPPITVPAFIAGLLILVLSDEVLAAFSGLGR